MPNSYPIGLFDSGLGGLSIWRALVNHLPQEAMHYLADSAYCPYGARPAAEIIRRARTITYFLLDHGCKLIVVACNTASAAALETLRTEFDVPIVGLEPAVKPAAHATRTGHIGVLATAGTVHGDLFRNTSQRYANGIQVHVQIAEGLVEQIETGHLDSPVTQQLLYQYLTPMLTAGVDQIVLGCTHYPLLMPLIQHIVGGQAEIIEPAQAVARQVERILTLKNILHPAALTGPNGQLPHHTFYTTGQPRTFQFHNGQINREHSIFFEPIDL